MADNWKAPQNRKWEASDLEKGFLKLVEEHGYKVVGIKEYTTQTNYKIVKNCIFQDFMVYHTGGVKAEDLFATFERFYNIRAEYEQMLADYEEKNAK